MFETFCLQIYKKFMNIVPIPKITGTVLLITWL